MTPPTFVPGERVAVISTRPGVLFLGTIRRIDEGRPYVVYDGGGSGHPPVEAILRQPPSPLPQDQHDAPAGT